MWIKENLAYEQLSTIDCGDHEIIWLTVNLQGRKKLVLGGLYRPGSAPGHDISILEHLHTSLDHVCSFGTNVMLAGDFNVHNGPWLGSSKTTRVGEYLEEICAVHGLVQHVKTATRGNNPLDLILSDLGDRVSVDVTSPIGRSDHSVLLTKIATCPQREKRTTRRVWRYSKADWGRLGKFYRDVEWSKIISSDPNLACKGVTETILDGMHRHIPNKPTHNETVRSVLVDSRVYSGSPSEAALMGSAPHVSLKGERGPVQDALCPVRCMPSQCKGMWTGCCSTAP